MSPLDDLMESIRPTRERILSHPLYESIQTPDALCLFLEHHVFAVWDFMSLLKALQRHLTCVETPWLPTRERQSRRLVNEIVLAEESDEDGQGGYASHFELYLEAMTRARANPAAIVKFLERLREGSNVGSALDSSDVPKPARDFVQATWGFIESGSIAAVAAAFTLGREELIPDLFRNLVITLDRQEPGRLDLFRHYLDRHVELDADEHGPMAKQMLVAICGDDPTRWRDARFAATLALDARLTLWDGIYQQILLTAQKV